MMKTDRVLEILEDRAKIPPPEAEWPSNSSGEEYLVVFGEWLRTMRATKGLTLAQLQEKSTISATTLGAWERGHASPQMQKIHLLANALDVPASEITNVVRDSQLYGENAKKARRKRDVKV